MSFETPARPYPNTNGGVRKSYEERIRARAATIKAFRHFLRALSDELACNGNSGNDTNRFTDFCLVHIRRITRTLRDDEKRIQQHVAVSTVLDLLTAWDEWTTRQQKQLSRPMYKLHCSLAAAAKSALKAWRLYWIELQLPETVDVMVEANASDEAPTSTPEEERD